MWICGRVLRISLRPTGRVYKLWTTQKSELTTACTHSQASRPHIHKLNYNLYFFKQKGTFLKWRLEGHFNFGLTLRNNGVDGN